MTTIFPRLLKGEPLKNICKDETLTFEAVIKILASKDAKHNEFKMDFFRIQCMRPFIMLDEINRLSTELFDDYKQKAAQRKKQGISTHRAYKSHIDDLKFQTTKLLAIANSKNAYKIFTSPQFLQDLSLHSSVAEPVEMPDALSPSPNGEGAGGEVEVPSLGDLSNYIFVEIDNPNYDDDEAGVPPLSLRRGAGGEVENEPLQSEPLVGVCNPDTPPKITTALNSSPVFRGEPVPNLIRDAAGGGVEGDSDKEESNPKTPTSTPTTNNEVQNQPISQQPHQNEHQNTIPETHQNIPNPQTALLPPSPNATEFKIHPVRGGSWRWEELGRVYVDNN